MSFESIRSLEIELETAKEIPNKNWDYINQVRFEIVRWAISDRFDDADIMSPSELDARREAHNGIERAGVYFIASKWIVGLGFEEDIMEVYNNINGERNLGRYDLNDNYILDEKRNIYIGAFILNGDVVYAEIWYDDHASAYIRLPF